MVKIKVPESFRKRVELTRDEIKKLSEIQDAIYISTVNLIGFRGDKLAEDCVFDYLFNGGDHIEFFEPKVEKRAKRPASKKKISVNKKKK